MRIGRLIRAFDSNASKRDKAVKALIALKDQRSIEPLLMVLGSENKDIRKAAMEVLVGLGETNWRDVIEGNLNDFRNLGLSKDPRIFDVLLKAFESSNYEIRCGAVDGLKELKDPRIITHLISALEDRDKYVRAHAVQALGNLNDQRAVEPLIKILKDDIEEIVRLYVVYALGNLKDQRAVEPLVITLGDSSTKVSKAASRVLGDLDVQWIEKPLINIIENKRYDTRTIPAIQLLGDIKSSLAVDPLIGILENKKIGDKTQREAIKALGKINDRRAREPLLKAKDDISLRNAPIVALEELSDRIPIKELIESLKDPYPNNRLMAIRALGRSKDPRSVNPLIEIIGKESGNIKQAAVEALGDIKDKMAVDPLIQSLKNAENYIKEAIVIALGSIGDKKAVEPLVQVLECSNKCWTNLRVETIRALGNLKSPEAVQPLISLIGDKDDMVRVETAKTLSILGENQWLDVIRGDKGDFKRLVKIKDNRIFEAIIGALGAEDDKVRINVAIALGRLKDIRAVRPLIKALNDKTNKVRIEALKALSVFRDVKTASSLINSRVVKPLIEKLTVGSPEVCAEAAKELGIIGAKEAVNPIISCFKKFGLDRHSVKVKEACIEALGMIGDPGASEFFISIIKDRIIFTDPEVFSKAYIKVNGNNDIETLFEILKHDIGYWAWGPYFSERRFRIIVKILGELKEPGSILPLIKLIPEDFRNSIFYINDPKREQDRQPNYMRYPLFIDAALKITGASIKDLRGFNYDKRKKTALLLQQLRNEDIIKPITREITDTVQLIHNMHAPGIPPSMEETVYSMRKLENNLFMIHNALKKVNLH
jgi:HEAT repeat protein/phage-related protein